MRYKNIELLYEMLRYKRPHDTATEHFFVKKFIDSVEGMQADGFGNRYIRVGENPTTMWSCHVDTVHRTEGAQSLIYYEDCFMIECDPRNDNNEPLGADDAAGVWLMLHMIEARVPGLYIFHRGEEKGGLGSDYIAENEPEIVKGITHAIGLDRRGTSDIITHQLNGRCCSDDFAIHLSEIIQPRGVKMEPCDGGIFTDTANYLELIPECTNISVGYYDEHTRHEALDIYFLSTLLDALIDADYSNMPVVKKVDEPFMYGPTGPAWNRKRVEYLSEGDLWELYANEGAEVLIQILLDFGTTDEEVWDAIAALDSKKRQFADGSGPF